MAGMGTFPQAAAVVRKRKAIHVIRGSAAAVAKTGMIVCIPKLLRTRSLAKLLSTLSQEP